MKQFILSVDSPFKFFLYWLLLSLMCIDWDVLVEGAINDSAFISPMAFLGAFFKFLFVWLLAVAFFYAPDTRFWAASRYVARPELRGLDIEKIKERHAGYTAIICPLLFVAILNFMGTSAVIIAIIAG